MIYKNKKRPVIGQKKSNSQLTEGEMKSLKETLGTAFEIYGKGDLNIKKDGLRILNGWGRIIFVISNNGKRIGLELTERWEKERQADRGEQTLYS